MSTLQQQQWQRLSEKTFYFTKSAVFWLPPLPVFLFLFDLLSLSLSLSECTVDRPKHSLWNILQCSLLLTFQFDGNNINVVLELYFKTASQYLTSLSDLGPHTLIAGPSRWKDLAVCTFLSVSSHVDWKTPDARQTGVQCEHSRDSMTLQVVLCIQGLS